MQTECEAIIRVEMEEVACPACDGRGRRALECLSCDGTGDEECAACRHGTWRAPWDVDPVECPTCKGAGYTQCSACAGLGRVWEDCTQCEGTGRVAEDAAEAIRAAREQAERQAVARRARLHGAIRCSTSPANAARHTLLGWLLGLCHRPAGAG